MRLRCIPWIHLTVLSCSSLAHAEAPPDRYTFPSAGVVYDTRTKLTWQLELSGIGYTLEDATTYCASLSLAGSGWRLPLISELLTLVDLTQENPAIDSKAFPNTPPGGFWASPGSNQDHGWSVRFREGDSHILGSGAQNFVRCVR